MRASPTEVKSYDPTLLRADQTTPAILCSGLIPVVLKSCGQAGEWPEEHRGHPRTGKMPREEALREAGLFSLDRAAEGRPSHCVPVFKGCLRRSWRLPFYKESCGKDKR